MLFLKFYNCIEVVFIEVVWFVVCFELVCDVALIDEEFCNCSLVRYKFVVVYIVI